ncbi:MAG: helix-turn-helix transcriptional regulator [Limnohabitans sp.]
MTIFPPLSTFESLQLNRYTEMSGKPKSTHAASRKVIQSPPSKPATSIPSFDQLADSAFIRESQLVQSPKRPGRPAPLPFSAPTLWRKVKAGTFPKPIKLSERVTGWKVGDVRAWMAAQAIA